MYTSQNKSLRLLNSRKFYQMVVHRRLEKEYSSCIELNCRESLRHVLLRFLVYIPGAVNKIKYSRTTCTSINRVHVYTATRTALDTSDKIYVNFYINIKLTPGSLIRMLVFIATLGWVLALTKFLINMPRSLNQ